VVISCIRIRHGIIRREPVSLRTLFAGDSFIRRRPVLFGAISFDLFAVLLGGATALLPIYVQNILHASPAAEVVAVKIKEFRAIRAGSTQS